MAKKIIEHKGKIEDIEGSRISVRFMNISACATCHAKGVCTASDMQEKIVNVIDDPQKYKIGEEVKVALQQSLGFKALLYGYVIPFFIVLVALFGFSALTSNEAIAGLASLGALVPYYLVLYRVKDRFSKVFSFTIEKLT
jgi:sigma-E factor negative regulatory protein RseC